MPTWLQIVLGICAPFIAVFSAFISYRQWQLSAYKIKHDLFERRWAVYAATNDAIVTALNGNAVEHTERFENFMRKSVDASFLFSEEIPKFLTEIGQAILDLRASERELKNTSVETPRRKEIESHMLNKHEWLKSQVDELVPKFHRYLDLSS